MIPGLPNVSAIRTFRVPRPLKSVAGLDGVKMVLVAVTESIPALMSVIALLAFVFAIFGILGLQFFLGKYHSRCRLTPYPVTTSWVQGLDYRDYACLDPDKGDLMRRNLNKQEGTKRDSDWYSPKVCLFAYLSHTLIKTHSIHVSRMLFAPPCLFYILHTPSFYLCSHATGHWMLTMTACVPSTCPTLGCTSAGTATTSRSIFNLSIQAK